VLKISALEVSIRRCASWRNVKLEVQRGQLAGLIGRKRRGETTLIAHHHGGAAAHGRRHRARRQDAARAFPRMRAPAWAFGYMPEDRRIIRSSPSRRT